MYKLPVWGTIGDAYRFIWSERRAWLDYALGPILVLTLIPTVISLGVFGTVGFAAPLPAPGQSPSHMFGVSAVIAFFAIYFVIVATYIAFAVAWHRRYLLGPDATAPREIITWRRRHWRFLLRGIALALLAIFAGTIVAFIVAFPAGAILGTVGGGGAEIAAVRVVPLFITWLLVIAIMGLLFVGPLLAFPAAAVEDEGFGIAQGWMISRGNRWRMLAIYLAGSFIPALVLNLVLFALVAGLASLIDAPLAEGESPSLTVAFVGALLTNAVYFLGVAIGVSLLSIMYRRLRDNVAITEQDAL
jgi:hypothetical protein